MDVNQNFIKNGYKLWNLLTFEFSVTFFHIQNFSTKNTKYGYKLRRSKILRPNFILDIKTYRF
jgi:hypothetical protein